MLGCVENQTEYLNSKKKEEKKERKILIVITKK